MKQKKNLSFKYILIESELAVVVESSEKMSAQCAETMKNSMVGVIRKGKFIENKMYNIVMSLCRAMV